MLIIISLSKGATFAVPNLVMLGNPGGIECQLILALLSDSLKLFDVRVIETSLSELYSFCWNISATAGVLMFTFITNSLCN